jgi:hypothetical protein
MAVAGGDQTQRRASTDAWHGLNPRMVISLGTIGAELLRRDDIADLDPGPDPARPSPQTATSRSARGRRHHIASWPGHRRRAGHHPRPAEHADARRPLPRMSGPRVPEHPIRTLRTRGGQRSRRIQIEPSGARWRVLQRVLEGFVLFFLAPIAWGSERRGAGRRSELARPPRSLVRGLSYVSIRTSARPQR